MDCLRIVTRSGRNANEKTADLPSGSPRHLRTLRRLALQLEEMESPHPSRGVDGERVRFEPDPVIEAYKRDIDRSLLRENLKLSVQERLDRLVELQRLAAELKAAGHRARAAS